MLDLFAVPPDILKKYDAQKDAFESKLNIYSQQLLRLQESYSEFKKMFQHVSINKPKMLEKNDVLKIMTFYDPNYVNEIESAINTGKNTLEMFRQFPVKNVHYTKRYLEQLRDKNTTLEKLVPVVRNRCSLLNEDIRLLKKCSTKSYKFKVFLRRKIFRR